MQCYAPPISREVSAKHASAFREAQLVIQIVTQSAMNKLFVAELQRKQQGLTAENVQLVERIQQLSSVSSNSMEIAVDREAQMAQMRVAYQAEILELSNISGKRMELIVEHEAEIAKLRKELSKRRTSVASEELDYLSSCLVNRIDAEPSAPSSVTVAEMAAEMEKLRAENNNFKTQIDDLVLEVKSSRDMLHSVETAFMLQNKKLRSNHSAQQDHLTLLQTKESSAEQEITQLRILEAEQQKQATEDALELSELRLERTEAAQELAKLSDLVNALEGSALVAQKQQQIPSSPGASHRPAMMSSSVGHREVTEALWKKNETLRCRLQQKHQSLIEQDRPLAKLRDKFCEANAALDETIRCRGSAQQYHDSPLSQGTASRVPSVGLENHVVRRQMLHSV
eukprot:gnl/MRDRNA2_/MRDRNA2_126507_c0_seq1.p1 gnl/MRDRNA2_/MRDRNA2_126507_c0~~gnl/MRDRNA2_/MRDRNA2_126507_c0_seq1.p1  ORF type:complete len:398 (+),score=86.41 gnl/MRDRNA2_/MRDRNA2_126507_c0_seq1:46-1239(+)